MAKSLLEQLREMTVVVADTGDIQAIEKFTPRDATTNPSLITAAAQMPQYQEIVDETLLQAKKDSGSSATETQIATLAFDRLAVSFGKKILEIIPQRVSTEVDARLSYDTEATIAKARDLIAQYEASGIGRDRVLIKIASTWEGIKAAEVLEKEDIHCNLTLLFGLHQAIACAEANITLISPFVGRILDWYTKETGKEYIGAEDPGVQSVTKIYNYYKKFGYKTEVMGASFRNISEITELAGCDLLTISPKLLAELDTSEEQLIRKLSPDTAMAMDIEKITMDKATFDQMHAADRMANEKLDEGIKGFTKALETLEQLLAARLFRLEAGESVGHAAEEIFLAYDLDGDGFITREEWLGSDAVFDALDEDHDGKISPEEMGVGLGGVFQLVKA
ncbi:transaldolase [Desertifilum sp. FACHB-1129]|uniref:Transaldolase n=1 Tax=Desertifilum tharense IPPAS B-1220 TaxID=1781255 RepID=A0A1E5QEM1_9CYAN|nr:MULTISPECIES: transaldolase [Desertifilum]MDA0212672.1 transaldolase [Cyanobacteria bacterium FC1]MBD2313097.1 transaldolase [Desertifilum sp. FACHB-1129]MBD2324097.1 transaldolase [Desertifilum sp. FACHB-866]MBD2334032.1 transaldolase [Desertifilum sp. FACHB-868]OEJ73120.1 transaldolase [Desertifilum tharense IPPAS B-1220]